MKIEMYLAAFPKTGEKEVGPYMLCIKLLTCLHISCQTGPPFFLYNEDLVGQGLNLNFEFGVKLAGMFFRSNPYP